MRHQAPIRTLLFSTLYPSSVWPGHGVFVEARLRELLKSDKVETKVIAPVPWFFSTDPKYAEYARFAKTPMRENWNGMDVLHPRYFLPPKIGMNIAPFVLALGAKTAVQRLLEDGYDFDLIDAHYYYPDGVAAALLARHFNKPFTVTARGTDINLIANHSIPRQLMLWASNRAHASIGVSSALTEAMERMGMLKSKLHMMPNGVDYQKFQLQPQATLRKELGWPEAPTLISVGNLIESKGHHIAIESLQRLQKFRLMIVGEGPARSALETLANRLNVASRIQFFGHVNQHQLVKYYGASDILILASSREGWPNVLLESMACGTPVVASRVGGIPEIVTSADSGRLMAACKASDVASCVEDLWSALPNREKVRERTKQCGWQRTTDAQVRLFGKIVGTSADSA